MSWQDAWLADRPRWADATTIPINVLVPLYQEQELVASVVAYWRERCEEDPELHVYLVTTDKEGAAEETTAALTQQVLVATPTPRLKHIHVTEVHAYRAVQLNAGVEAIRNASATPADATWVGVYNADSRPCPSTFAELRFAIEQRPDVRAYQQFAQYVVPESRPSSVLMEAFAALQTWWTYTSWFARAARGTSPVRAWARTAPFSTFGHGEYVRLDALDEIGGFPAFAYADGLLLGWLLRFAGDTLGLLASPDFAEVPRNPAEIVRQHRAWIRGLLNVRAAAHHADRGSAGRTARRAVVAGHLAIATSWGLRPLLVLSAAVWGVGQVRTGARRDGSAMLAALVLYSAFPQLVSVAYRRLPGQDVAELAPRPMRVRQLAGAPVTMLLDGLGFAPAARDAMTSGGAPPPKTRR